MSKFDDLVPAGTDALWREIRDLRATVEELQSARSNEATTVSAGVFVVDKAGGFRVFDQETGVSTFYAGAGTDSDTGEPTGQTTVYWNRNDGTRFLDIGHFLETGEQVGTWRDHNHTGLIQDDRQGIGLDRPWLSFYGTHQFEGVSTEGTVYQYRALPIAQVASETVLWEGRIPLMLHPRVELHGTWGSSTGSSNCTYRAYVADEFVGSWTTTGTELRNGRASGAFGFEVPMQYFSFSDVRVHLTCQAAGTGNVACQVRGAYMRGSPAP